VPTFRPCNAVLPVQEEVLAAFARSNSGDGKHQELEMQVSEGRDGRVLQRADGSSSSEMARDR